MNDQPRAEIGHEDLMRGGSTVTVESNHVAATVFVTGELTMMTVLQVMTLADQSPETVRAICVDLRGTRGERLDLLRALESGLGEWRSSRNGISRVMLPEATDDSIIALKFPHQRWRLRDD